MGKGFKAEWMAVKDHMLYVGGLGKVWTTQTGVWSMGVWNMKCGNGSMQLGSMEYEENDVISSINIECSVNV